MSLALHKLFVGPLPLSNIDLAKHGLISCSHYPTYV